MVKQLQFSSVERGLSGHSGFQYVAASPAVSDEEKRLVLPHMTYRPPPELAARPDAADLAGFPVALGYLSGGPRRTITQTRYLGRDYSGRYGNFLAHALIIDGDELEGIRPIELWRSPIWPQSVAENAVLPELAEIMPNPDLSPDVIAQHLDARGPDAYTLLGSLLDAVQDSLARNVGRILLTAVDTDEIALWIAALFYSLPATSTDELSFLSYSADPDAAQYRLVGTTPGIWATARPRGRVFHLDMSDVAEIDSTACSPFATAVVRAWRERDLEAIDTLIEMSEAGAEVEVEVGSAAQRAAARHDPRCRLDAVDQAVRRYHSGELSGRDLAASVARLWDGNPPSARESLDVLEVLDRDIAYQPDVFAMLGQALASGLADARASAQLARAVLDLSRTAAVGERDRWSDQAIHCDAEFVLAVWEVCEAFDADLDPGAAIESVYQLRRHASPLLRQHADRALAGLLRSYDSAFLAQLLAEMAPGFRCDIAEVWIESTNLHVDPHFLAETILRFYRLGQTEGQFEYHLRNLFGTRSAKHRCERYLGQRDPGFVTEFNDLLRGRRAHNAAEPGHFLRKFTRER
ncbi:hypothetical protein ACFVMC_28485 [Nocardia sp. NPDC127579]|uniref:GAP1-N2 domain-containing protein n=1 Tax=Nocardia sp. NPDC127579 TaxID=3345402 RepID=UPI00363C5D09